MTDLTSTKYMINGCFYSFRYNPTYPVINIDYNPLIYCIGPSIRSINNVTGLNFHHVPKELRLQFLINFNKKYDFMNKDRVIIDETEINRLLPGIKVAIREYNRKNMSQVYTISNKSIPTYINSIGDLKQYIPQKELLQYFKVDHV